MRLTELVVPATKRPLVVVLAPHDSEQFSVSVLETVEQARQLFRAATREEPQFEVAVGSDVVLTTRNIYVVFDTTGAEYEIDDLRQFHLGQNIAVLHSRGSSRW